MLFKSITVLASFLCLNTVSAQKPEIVLYNQVPISTATFVATTNIGSENQDCLPQSIKATHVCVNQGTWIFYPDAAFEMVSGLASQIYQNTGASPICEDLPTHLNRAVGSYRPAGDPAGAPCALNLYVDKEYASNEELLVGDATEVPFAFNSVIRTGACTWEFFMKEGFEGFSECLLADESFVPDFTTRFGVQAGDIKSIRQGCMYPNKKLNPKHRSQASSSF